MSREEEGRVTQILQGINVGRDLKVGGNVNINIELKEECVPPPIVSFPCLPQPLVNFTGRKEILEKLHSTFDYLLTTTTGIGEECDFRRKTVALTGIGGIGKTETARKFALEYQQKMKSEEKEEEEKRFEVCFINAETHDALLASFTSIGHQLRLEKEENAEILAKTIYTHCSTHKISTLFIFDNVEQIEGVGNNNKYFSIYPFLPNYALGEFCPLVLITSQKMDLMKGLKNIILIDHGLSSQETLLFFQKYFERTAGEGGGFSSMSKKTEFEKYVREIHDFTAGFPLALKLAVAYIRRECVENLDTISGSVKDKGLLESLRKYIVQYESQWYVNANDDGDSRNYNKIMANVFQLTIDKIRSQNYGDPFLPRHGRVAVSLLNCLAYLNPNGITIRQACILHPLAQLNPWVNMDDNLGHLQKEEKCNQFFWKYNVTIKNLLLTPIIKGRLAFDSNMRDIKTNSKFKGQLPSTSSKRQSRVGEFIKLLESHSSLDTKYNEDFKLYSETILRSLKILKEYSLLYIPQYGMETLIQAHRLLLKNCRDLGDRLDLLQDEYQIAKMEEKSDPLKYVNLVATAEFLRERPLTTIQPHYMTIHSHLQKAGWPIKGSVLSISISNQWGVILQNSLILHDCHAYFCRTKEFWERNHPQFYEMEMDALKLTDGWILFKKIYNQLDYADIQVDQLLLPPVEEFESPQPPPLLTGYSIWKGATMDSMVCHLIKHLRGNPRRRFIMRRLFEGDCEDKYRCPHLEKIAVDILWTWFDRGTLGKIKEFPEVTKRKIVEWTIDNHYIGYKFQELFFQTTPLAVENCERLPSKIFYTIGGLFGVFVVMVAYFSGDSIWNYLISGLIGLALIVYVIVKGGIFSIGSIFGGKFEEWRVEGERILRESERMKRIGRNMFSLVLCNPWLFPDSLKMLQRFLSNIHLDLENLKMEEGELDGSRTRVFIWDWYSVFFDLSRNVGSFVFIPIVLPPLIAHCLPTMIASLDTYIRHLSTFEIEFGQILDLIPPLSPEESEDTVMMWLLREENVVKMFGSILPKLMNSIEEEEWEKCEPLVRTSGRYFRMLLRVQTFEPDFLRKLKRDKQFSKSLQLMLDKFSKVQRATSRECDDDFKILKYLSENWTLSLALVVWLSFNCLEKSRSIGAKDGLVDEMLTRHVDSLTEGSKVQDKMSKYNQLIITLTSMANQISYDSAESTVWHDLPAGYMTRERWEDFFSKPVRFDSILSELRRTGGCEGIVENVEKLIEELEAQFHVALPCAYRWSHAINFHDPLPQGSLSVGNESTRENEEQFYITRVTHGNAGTMPGFRCPTSGKCHYSFDGRLHIAESYQTLLLDERDVLWVSSGNGEILRDAVCGGRTGYGEATYIGRVRVEEENGKKCWVVGKLLPRFKFLSYPWEGNIYRAAEYQLLVLKSKDQS